MTDVYPDIEIYIKNPDLDKLTAWLNEHFDGVDMDTNVTPVPITLSASGTAIEAVLVLEAVKGKFASLWFKDNQTPWPTDIDCARSAFEALGQEIRCSTGPWEPGQPEEEQWFRLSDKGETRVHWQT